MNLQKTENSDNWYGKIKIKNYFCFFFIIIIIAVCYNINGRSAAWFF
jgi:hypothetical protein